MFSRCLGGRVANERTNSRLVELRCAEDKFFSIGDVPECVEASHCVGPTAAAIEEAKSARPSRDPKVNEPIVAKCEDGDEVRGSCFPDGNVRFSSGCGDANTSAPVVYSECDPNGVRIEVNAAGEFGWIVLAGNAENYSVADETRFKFELFRNVIGGIVNLTEAAEKGLGIGGEDIEEEEIDICMFRFVLPDNSRLLLGMESGTTGVVRNRRRGSSS